MVYFLVSSHQEEGITILHQDMTVVGSPGGARVQDRSLTQLVDFHLRALSEKQW